MEVGAFHFEQRRRTVNIESIAREGAFRLPRDIRVSALSGAGSLPNMEGIVLFDLRHGV
jgi:hypothetical protein